MYVFGVLFGFSLSEYLKSCNFEKGKEILSRPDAPIMNEPCHDKSCCGVSDQFQPKSGLNIHRERTTWEKPQKPFSFNHYQYRIQTRIKLEMYILKKKIQHDTYYINILMMLNTSWKHVRVIYTLLYPTITCI